MTISPELKLVPEFKEVISRDKDPGKRIALLVFAYIYFMYDFRSPYSKYSEDERHDRLVRELNLGDRWTPDQAASNAIAKYRELLETPTIRTLKSIREGLVASANAIDMITRNINSAVEEDESVEDTVKLLTSLLAIADKLPKVVESIAALEEKVKREQANDTKLRGGGSKGIFED